MTAPRLQASEVCWAVGGRYVLLDLELRLDAGSLVVITGANGAGKSSLLRLLHGALRPDAGTIALDGLPLPEVEAAQLARRIALLGHKPGLFLDLDAAENLNLFAALAGRPLPDGAAAELLGRVGLDRADHRRPVRHFSRGMKQRAALARILAVGSDIWLLDEPSTGLDAQGVALLAELTGQARDRGTALVLVTHDPSVRALADRHLVLGGGRLHEQEVRA